MAYQAFRDHGFPTFYGENKTAWQADILESGLIFAFCIVATSFFIILPGIRGKEKLFTFIRVPFSLYIGAVLILTNWTYIWETAETHTRTKYKAGTGAKISTDIGVHIGLRRINITLKALSQGRYRWRHDNAIREVADWLEQKRKKERRSNSQRHRINFVKPGETRQRQHPGKPDVKRPMKERKRNTQSSSTSVNYEADIHGSSR